MEAVRIARFTVTQDRRPEALRAIKEHLIPKMESVGGFRGGYWLIDDASGQGTAITIWDSAATRLAFGTEMKVAMEASGAITGTSIEDLPLVASSRGAVGSER